MLMLICFITMAQLLAYSAVYRIIYLTQGMLIRYPVMYYYRYILAAIISVLPTLIFIGSDVISKKEWNIRLAIHFILTLSSTIFAQLYYFTCEFCSWRDHFNPSYSYFLPTFVPIFVIIYFGAHWVFYRQQRKISDELNERIRSSFHDEG